MTNGKKLSAAEMLTRQDGSAQAVEEKRKQAAARAAEEENVREAAEAARAVATISAGWYDLVEATAQLHSNARFVILARVSGESQVTRDGVRQIADSIKAENLGYSVHSVNAQAGPPGAGAGAGMITGQTDQLVHHGALLGVSP